MEGNETMKVVVLDWMEAAKFLGRAKDWARPFQCFQCRGPGLPTYTPAAKNALQIGESLGRCLANLMEQGRYVIFCELFALY